MPKKFSLGSKVIVNNFGSHEGTVIETKPLVEIQGRLAVPKKWVRVQLLTGQIWTGHVNALKEKLFPIKLSLPLSY